MFVIKVVFGGWTINIKPYVGTQREHVEITNKVIQDSIAIHCF